MHERAIIRVRATGFVFGYREGIDEPDWTTVVVTPGTEGSILTIGSNGYNVIWDQGFLIDTIDDGQHLGELGDLGHVERLSCVEVNSSSASPPPAFVEVRAVDPVADTIAALDDTADRPWEPKVGDAVRHRPSLVTAIVKDVGRNTFGFGAPTFTLRFDNGFVCPGYPLHEIEPITAESAADDDMELDIDDRDLDDVAADPMEDEPDLDDTIDRLEELLARVVYLLRKETKS
jgi:hypothetical protein